MPATTLVGLDVGSSTIRAVEATTGKDRPTVSRFGQVSLPDGAVADGLVKDERAVATALRQLWAEQDFGTRNVVLGVTHSQVVVREVDVTNLPAKELRQALPYLVKDVLPLPVDEVTLDFYPLEDAATAEDTVHGLVIAAPKDAVISVVKAVEQAGLHVAQVDLACFAVLRACAHLAHDTEAVVDLGSDVTTVVVHTDGTPKIVRTIPRGGNEITRLLASRLGIGLADAELVKRRHGLRPLPAGAAQTAEGTDLSESAAVVAEALRPLVTELRGSFSYFSSANPSERVVRVALVGGASLLPGLTDQLTRDLGVPAFLSDPLQRVNRPKKAQRPDGPAADQLGRFRSAAAVSIGLTLGAA
ncbi:type IV pilus assembly protein PilM [Jatrophihabitans fulvus]